MDSAYRDTLSIELVKITPTDTLETLWHEAMDIGLDKFFVQDSVWTQTDVDRIIEIAQMCPYHYGPAVYMARNLALSMDTLITWHMHDCEVLPPDTSSSQRLAAPDSEEIIEHTTQQNEAHEFRIFPNPSRGSVTVECSQGSKDMAQIIITDATGKQVYSKQHRCSGLPVTISGLSEGMYTCLLWVNGTTPLKEKLIILRE